MTVLFLKAFTLTLLGLLPMVNPPTTATLLLGQTRGMSAQQVSEQINKTAIYLFITLCITLFAGTSVLSFFGLTLPSLRPPDRLTGTLSSAKKAISIVLSPRWG
ncbi:TPA: hypothetical protein ON570_004193 [Citrobacter werkmanii]|nr:hypothetical protein [Citrobacter werkmanii]